MCDLLRVLLEMHEAQEIATSKRRRDSVNASNDDEGGSLLLVIKRMSLYTVVTSVTFSLSSSY